MKFRVLFKTPDALEWALKEHMDTHCDAHDEHDQDCNACLALEESSLEKIAQIKQVGKKFINYDENVVIEFDTDTGTATVVPVR